MRQASIVQRMEDTNATATRDWKLYGAYALVVLVVVGGIGAAVFFGKSGNAAATNCTGGARRTLQLQDDAFSQTSLTVKKCDKIVIQDKDKLSYDLNFGEHEAHISYPGYTPKTLLPGESVTITATETGDYLLHDHFRDNAELHLTVRQ